MEPSSLWEALGLRPRVPVAGSCDLGPVEGMGALMLWKGNVCVLGSAWFVPAPWGAFSTSSAGLHSPSITVVVVLFWKLHLSFFLSKYEQSYPSSGSNPARSNSGFASSRKVPPTHSLNAPGWFYSFRKDRQDSCSYF